jgi:glycosyltransferase involved in cell wall biosynthesis
LERFENGDQTRSRAKLMSDVSVVICAYTLDRWDDLNAAVASVRRQTRPAREIFVVVDNNEILLARAKREIDGVIIVPNTKVPGLCGGRMTGAELATAGVIAFLDDDAIADEHWLEELLTAYESDRVLGVGGHIEPLWRNPCPWWFPPEFNWIIGCTYRGLRVHNGQIRNMIGANMSVRADVLHGSGGFASKLGRREGGGAVIGVVAESCEETEFCIRASGVFPGGVWLYCPRARIRHVVPAQRTTWRYFVHRCRMEGTAKAVLTGLAGSRDGLRSERRYVLTLAQSVLRYICTGQLGRAIAICAGLAITTSAYGRARLARAMVRTSSDRITPITPISLL